MGDVEAGQGVPAGRRVTLAEWVPAVTGRTVETAWTHWVPRPDFPRPVGTRPTGRPGSPVDLYDEAALAAWYAGRPELHPPARLSYPGGRDEVVSIGVFARGCVRADGTALERPVDPKTVRQALERPGAPAPVEDGWPVRYRAGDLLDAMNRRPGSGNRRRRAGRGSVGKV